MEHVRHQNSKPICALPGCPATPRKENVCSRCKDVSYCTRQHQIAGMREHKKQCTNPGPVVSDAVQRSIPSDERKEVQVMLFPANGLPPQIITVQCRLRMSDIHHGLREEWMDLSSLIDSSEIVYGAIGSTRRSSKPHSRLYLALAPQSHNDDPDNLCVRRYSEGRNELSWHGNVIGVRLREPTTKFIQYFDVTEQDLTPFVTYFKEFGTRRAPALPDVLILHSSASADVITSRFDNPRWVGGEGGPLR